MLWSQGYVFPKPVMDLRSDAEGVDELQTELSTELSPGHMLYGHELRIVAIGPVDELIVEVDSDAVALVHLVWSGRAESTPDPRTEILSSPEQLMQHLAHYEGRRDLD